MKTSKASVQEIGLALVVLVIGGILAGYGWFDAAPGRPNAFLNFDNLVDGVATPMSYYAIMAVNFRNTAFGFMTPLNTYSAA